MTTQPEYWCDRSLLVTIDGPDGRHDFRIEKPFARLGAHEASEVVLHDHRVAGRSLYLHATESGVFYLGLPRSTPGHRSPAGWFRPKQQVPFGPYLVSARLADQEENSQSAPELDFTARGIIADPRPLVAVSLDGRELATCRLSRRLTVLGSHRSSNIQLKGGRVSDTHAILYWSRPTLWVVDLLGSVGTLFEGHPIVATQLPEGESIVLGNVTLAHCPPPHGRDNAPPGNVAAAAPPLASRRLRHQIRRLISRKRRFEARQTQWEQQRLQTEAELNETFNRLTLQRAELDALANRLEERQAELDKLAGRLQQPAQETPQPTPKPLDATDEDPDRLVQRVTGRLVASQRGAVLRRAAKQLAIALLLGLTTATAIFLLHRYADVLRSF